MGVYVRPQSADLADLATLLASTDWTAAKFHLSKANITPTPTTVLTDYDTDEADFAGYAAASVTFSAPHVDAAGDVVANALANFLASGATPENMLYTYFLTNTAGTKLLLGGRLDGSPIPIANIGDGTSQLLSVQIGPGTVETVP